MASKPPFEPSMKREKVDPSAFRIDLVKGDYNVIGIVKDELITEHIICQFNGRQFIDKNINKISVVERYGYQLPPAVGLVKGFEMTQGAIASSVAHDSHNIVVIGADDKSMATAVNHLISIGGGFCVVRDGKVVAELTLPVCGLISLAGSEEIAERLYRIKSAAKSIGVPIAEPFVQMSFLALPVIPALKMTAKGLFSVDQFNFIGLRCDGASI
jgi:adenine deaminase